MQLSSCARMRLVRAVRPGGNHGAGRSGRRPRCRARRLRAATRARRAQVGLGSDSWLGDGLGGGRRAGGLSEAQLTDRLGSPLDLLPIPRNASATISWWQMRQVAFNRAVAVRGAPPDAPLGAAPPARSPPACPWVGPGRRVPHAEARGARQSRVSLHQKLCVPALSCTFGCRDVDAARPERALRPRWRACMDAAHGSRRAWQGSCPGRVWQSSCLGKKLGRREAAAAHRRRASAEMAMRMRQGKRARLGRAVKCEVEKLQYSAAKTMRKGKRKLPKLLSWSRTN